MKLGEAMRLQSRRPGSALAVGAVLLAGAALAGCDDDPGAGATDLATDAQVQLDRGPDAQRPDGAIIDARMLDGGPTDLGGPDRGADADLDATLADAGADLGLTDATPGDAAVVVPDTLRINEVMASNEGAWVDDQGETDDWIELYNPTATPIELAGWSIGDREVDLTPLPLWVVPAGGFVVLTADGSPEQGPGHLPFKISSGGETIYLNGPDGARVDQLQVGTSAPNDAWQRRPDGGEVAATRCRYATPGRPNGDRCGPGAGVDQPDRVYLPYTFSEPWPAPTTPLILSELALRPAPGGEAFVEVLNGTDAPVRLADFSLEIGAQSPGQPWPARSAGVALSWPMAELAAGARAVVSVSPAARAVLEASPDFEGVVSLWGPAGNYPTARIDFMAWPEGAALSLPAGDQGRHRFCAHSSPGVANDDCAPLASRPVPGRLRHLRTPGDFAALAAGGVERGVASVKFLIDLGAGDVVHLLGTERWDLHYRFVREAIEGQSVLDRCDPEENALFNQGWRAFSVTNYEQEAGRSYLMGTLVHYAGNGLDTLEFASGDRILAQQMRRAFFAGVAHAWQPTAYAIRPQDDHQLEQADLIEGQVPLVGPRTPFVGETFQPLTEAVGYGVLTFVPVAELDSTALGPQTLLVTDDVPNDIPLVGGLITEAFQTPLAHVNLLSRNRNTPNMALADAREDPTLAPLFGQLVRLEVTADHFEARLADPAEAEAFWEARRPQGPLLVPALDVSVTGIVPLPGLGFDALPYIGAKAAGLAELTRVQSPRAACLGAVPVPASPFAIPLSWERAHFVASGAAALLAELEADPTFRGDPLARDRGLRRVQSRILVAPVDPGLLALVDAYIREHHSENQPMRFRSSSNTEDLPGFNGAGLYTSTKATLSDPDASIQAAIRTVWASLWNTRAYDERTFFGVDHDSAAMGVLVHPAFPSEKVNGVGVSRDLTDPIRGDHYYNVQVGEASVTNPAPGVTTEQVVWRLYRVPHHNVQVYSSLTGGALVQSEAEVAQLACYFQAIHSHFQNVLDPAHENPWFAMDIEFKRLGPARTLIIKQARPYSFGAVTPPADCRTL